MRTGVRGMVLILAAASAVRAGEPPEKALAKVANTLSPSMVTVEYTLRFDRGEPPRSLGWMRHGGADLVRDERPLELAGYLLAPDRVLTVDPLIHPRFIETIRVQRDGERVFATPCSYLESGNGLVLQLEKQLAGARPLAFDAKATPSFAAGYARRNAAWQLTVTAFYRAVSWNARGMHWPASPFHLLVADGGAVVGIPLLDELALDDSWKGSPLEQAAMSAEQMTAKLAATRELAARALMRVELGFRSPKSKKKSAFSFLESEDTQNVTELDVVGVLVADDTVLVLADLEPKVTARLERILVHRDDGEPVAAEFRASLRRYGAFVAHLRSPLPGKVSYAGERIQAWRGHPVLAVEVLVKGVECIRYAQPARFTSLRVGWRGQIHPSLGGDEENVFLFDPGGGLLAFPVRRRELFAERPAWQSAEDPRLHAAAHLRVVLADPEQHSDPNNAPLDEKEEARLAWMGVVLQPLDEELARANRVSALSENGETGALVSYVYPGSPADRAGIKAGYILLRLHAEGHPKPLAVKLEESPFDDLGFDVPAEIQERLGGRRPPWPSAENAFTRMLTDLGAGRKYTAEFFYDGKVVRMPFTVERGPIHYGAAARYKSKALGLSVRDLTYEVRRHFQMKADEPGVIVAKVEPGKKAAVAGIRQFEVITHVDEKPIPSVEAFEEELKRAGERRLSLKHKAQTRLVKIVVPERD